MYKFEDTIKHDVVDSSLPAEAMNWNGSFLEKQITGYRTLGVEGRELATTTITTSEMETVDGTKTIAKKHSPRTITVYYQLISESDEAFREAYNKLNGLLTKERTRFYFNDEPDKYFEGISTTAYDVPRGRNAITSSFDIYCDIPYKYALNLSKYTASMSADNILSMEVDNRGTVETPLSVTAEIKDDNGYFGIVGPNSAMEFGKILEADGYVDMSEWVFVDQLDNKTSDWFINTGTIEWKNSNAGDPNLIQGNLEFKNGKVVPTAWGTQPTDNRWYGPTLSRNISAKKTDEKRDGNWRLRFWLVHKSHGDPRKLGRQEINLSRNNTNSNVTFAIYDDVSGSNKTVVQFKILGEVKFGFKVNENFTEFYGSVDIWKEDDTIYLKLFSNDTKSTATYSYSDDRYKALEFDKLTYWASRYRNYPICEMSFNYVDFQWIGTKKFVDVPNRYADGMTLNYNGDSGKYYVNDVLTMNDIVQGSLDIMIPPGKWTVEYYYSDFCEIPPIVTAEIRERWL